MKKLIVAFAILAAGLQAQTQAPLQPQAVVTCISPSSAMFSAITPALPAFGPVCVIIVQIPNAQSGVKYGFTASLYGKGTNTYSITGQSNGIVPWMTDVFILNPGDAIQGSPVVVVSALVNSVPAVVVPN